MRNWLFGLATGMLLCASAIATIWFLIRQDASPYVFLLLYFALIFAALALVPFLLALSNWTAHGLEDEHAKPASNSSPF